MKKEIAAKIRNSSCCFIAGGQSSRMGVPKGLLPFGKGTVLDQLIQKSQVFDDVFLSANLEEYKAYGLPMVTDTYVNIGPLSAVYTAVTTAKHPWVLLLPCDMPLVNEEVIAALFQQELASAQAVIIHDGEKPYPVLGLYHKSILPELLEQISSGNHRLRELLKRIHTIYVNFPDKLPLSNMNTREDYEQLLKQME